MEEKLGIRFAVESDVGSIAAVAKTTWKSTYEGLIPPEMQQVFLDKYYAPDMLAREIRRGDAWFWVAERGDAVVGYAQVLMRGGGARAGTVTDVAGDTGGDTRGDTAELARVYVLPQAQRVGVGGALVENAIRFLRKLGVSALVVTAEQNNRSAVGFYAKFGFAPCEERVVTLGDQSVPVVDFRLPVSGT